MKRIPAYQIDAFRTALSTPVDIIIPAATQAAGPNWGKPDRSLARGACESIMRVTCWPLPFYRHQARMMSACGWCVVGLIVLIVLALAGAGVKS